MFASTSELDDVTDCYCVDGFLTGEEEVCERAALRGVMPVWYVMLSVREHLAELPLHSKSHSRL